MMARPRIVIVGGGFGGAYCASALERNLRREEADIVLLDRNNYFVFYPLLVEAGTGSLEPRHAVIPIRSFLKRTRFCMADVTGINRDRQRVLYDIRETDRQEELPYDHLVLALGSVTSLPDIPGLKTHGYEMKSLQDAVSLRDRAIRLLEIANVTGNADERTALLHFVVVGGNHTGVEVAGEFHQFLQRASRRYANVHEDECKVSLVEITDRLLPSFDEDLVRFAMRDLVRRKLNILLGNSVEEIQPDRARLKNGEILRTHTVIWCAGVAPNPLIAELSLPTDDRGYILCERELRVKEYDHIWAIGDCAKNPGPDGKPYPPTAQHAVQQAKHLAQNLTHVLRGKSATPCDIPSRGTLIGLGCRTGVAKVFGIKLAGFAAWFLYRTVYLFKMPTLARKIRVAFDWTLDLFLPGDPVQLGMHRTRDPTRHEESTAESRH